MLLSISPEMRSAEAFDVWLSTLVIDYEGVQSDAEYISVRSANDLRTHAKAAKKYFGNLQLDKIHAGHLHEYQRARAICDKKCGDWAAPAGANLIRKEIGTVIRVLRAAGAWSTHLEAAFRPLKQVGSDVGQAMTPAEQERFLRVAASREEWRVLYWWTIVALQTTASTNELRCLRRGDIFLDQGILQVRNEGAKNKFRVRSIPLTTPEIAWALDRLLDRAAGLGATAPFHYLFPIHCSANRYNPAKPMTVWGMRKPWEAARAAADIPWLRMYDVRHTAITRMAEAGTPVQVIMSYAGHISPRMQQHYTSISMQAKRKWAAATWAGAEMPWSTPAIPAAARPPAMLEWQQQALAAGWGTPAIPAAAQPPAMPDWQQQAMAAGWAPLMQLKRAG
jgi:integrase